MTGYIGVLCEIVVTARGSAICVSYSWRGDLIKRKLQRDYVIPCVSVPAGMFAD